MLASLIEAFARPIAFEKRDLLVRRWEELPEELRTEWQVVGQHLVHCAYTMGASYCSFGCTHCYLPKNANRVPTPSLAEMREQIDANRRLVGPGGGLQLTGGDLPDAYWRANRSDELVEIVRYANAAGVVPMLMTHGQVLLDHPEFLERLVRDGGLRKLALHVDSTQAGRPGFPLAALSGEADLHPLREAFVQLILETRRRTGAGLRGAMTVTVTENNLSGLGDILRWLIARPERLDAFRMISFQTEADVGRTRFSSRAVTPEGVWEQISGAVGDDLPRDNLWFGHPDCSNMTTLLITYPDLRAINMIGADPESRAFWQHILRHYGGIGSRGNATTVENLRRFALLLRRPDTLWRIARLGRHTLRAQGLGLSFLRKLAAGRVRPLNIVMHNFMGAAEVQAGGETVRKRLAACAFRGAVKQDGAWRAVPMCEMNASQRDTLYKATIDRSA